MAVSRWTSTCTHVLESDALSDDERNLGELSGAKEALVALVEAIEVRKYGELG